MVAMDAPMSSSLGAMGPLLRKLHLILAPEYRLPHSLKVGIKFLKEDLEDIGADLVEQSMVDFPNKMAKYWMDEVRELSYEIEDCVDNMMARHTGADTKVRSVHGHRVRRVKIARLPKTGKPCTRISKIVRFRTLVREASQRHKRYQLDGCIPISSYAFTHQHWLSTPCHGLAASYLVGIDDSKMKLVQSLTNEAEHQLKVVPIVGLAGVGKTTLAKELYRDLGRHYDCWAFVRVSRKPDMIKLFQSLLSQVQRHQQYYDLCTVQDLIDTLRAHLQDKRYFIVIDDLWEISAWDIVSGAFPESNSCSRIVVTAENVDVALECCGNQLGNVLKMRPLGNQDSGKLLCNRVFGSQHQCSDKLKEVLCGIIEMCGGLPLSVISVASLLSRQPENSELWHHVQKCLCCIWNVNPSLKCMQEEILNLVYSSLPHHLKTCLLYLSIYPEGYTVWKVDLVKQWIAEGFITATEGKDTYKVTESYFYELVNMGMIQPMQINYNDEVLSCMVHHIVLDLITQKSKQENFVATVNYSQTITATKAHRLSLHFTKTNFAKEPACITLSSVRSLAFFGLIKCMPSVVEFKLLRVLNLEFWGNHDEHMSFNLSRISQLLQLRYFKISSDNVVELPCQMRGLQFLETLEINARLSAVPLDIVHLPRLLHLRLRDEKVLPDGIGCIRSLRTLEYFDLSSNSDDTVRSLGELKDLQYLHLMCSTASSDEHLKRNLVALAYSLGKLGNLKSLTLTPGTLSTGVLFDGSNIVAFPPVFLERLELLPPICIFSRLPMWIGHLHKLCNLEVVVRELLMTDIDMLTGLPALTVLSLYVRQPTAEVIVFNGASFPVLKCFKFWCGVLCLAFQEETLPNLQRLKVGFNAHRGEQFGLMLTGVEHLLSLQVIDGRIGASAGAQESDRRAAESALRNSISKHSMSPRVNLQMVDYVDEEIPQLTDPPGSSSYALMPDGEVCTSGLTSPRKRKDNTEYCQYPGCIKIARGASAHCISHGGGSRCQTPGCLKGAQGKAAFCKGHGGGRRCEHLGCTKSVHGLTAFCIAHGGGQRCSHEGCQRASCVNSGLCIKHGDGERSQLLNQEIDGQIGADAGAQESDMTAAESVSKDIISKHTTSLRFDMQMADCVDKEIPEASSSLSQMSSIESSSYLGKHMIKAKECQYPGCVKGARGASGRCIGHGGGRRCHKPGCSKGAEGNTIFCKAHGGGRRCEFLGCTKSAEGRTDNCIAHGGGRRCSHEGCSRAARGRCGLCIKHGGGKRCTQVNCTKSAEGKSGLCISHGSGRRCLFAGCSKGSLGSTPFCRGHGGGKCCLHEGGGVCTESVYSGSDFCRTHGGGKRCAAPGCTKSARGQTDFCVGHGGGKRCRSETCTKSAVGRTDFCKAHGGGKRCKFENCTKFARRRAGYCVAHRDGNGCKFENCTKSADGSTDFCTEHAGLKRCTWGMVELILDIGDHQCDELAVSEIGFCAAHSAEIQDQSVPSGGASDPVLMHRLDVRPNKIVDASTLKGDQETKTCIEDESHVEGANFEPSSSTSDNMNIIYLR